MDLFQIDRTFAESCWSNPVIFHLFGTALILLHPETRTLAWIFFRPIFSLVMTTIILIEQLTNSMVVEAVKRSISSTKFETSNATTNSSVIKARHVTIQDVGDPLQWDELLIVMLLFVIALILFITGMYMVDHVQHGKDRSLRKYIDERKRFRKKKRKMELVLNQLINSSYNDAIMTSTSIQLLKENEKNHDTGISTTCSIESYHGNSNDMIDRVVYWSKDFSFYHFTSQYPVEQI